ncbi:MAG: hypothetical protein JRG93_20425 [Deltaproteobacteria bacterium]|nr:hypothetical protein [Deltaproteobacteria bacterium]
MWPWHGGIAEALTESYWSIGQRIAKEKLNTRARYHNAILTDLSADLAIGVRTLQRTVTFYQTYKRPPRIEGLSWAHYRVLMQLQDPDERSFYEDLAIDDALSVKRLTAAIQGDHYLSALEQPKGKPLKLLRPIASACYPCARAYLASSTCKPPKSWTKADLPENNCF